MVELSGWPGDYASSGYDNDGRPGMAAGQLGPTAARYLLQEDYAGLEPGEVSAAFNPNLATDAVADSVFAEPYTDGNPSQPLTPEAPQSPS